ncbi:MAG: hypothetical protein IJT83_01930 [Victivallales bacterium]|nr:hypothetical protein [Victivallales bacterium]
MKTKRVLIAVLMLCLAGGLFAQGIPNKIKLLLVDVGTIDSVAKTEKFLTTVDKVNMDVPPMPSPADSMADPDLRRHAARVNWKTGMMEYMQTSNDIRNENIHRRKVMEALRAAITGDTSNRLVVIAKDYLASALDKYGDFIQLVDRSEASLSEIEKAIDSKSQEDVACANLFLTVTLADMKQESLTVPVGDVKVRKTSYRRRAVASVRDFNNVRVFSCDVEAKAEFRETNVTKAAGHDPSDELIIDAMNQIAEKVGRFFLREYVVKVKIPKTIANEVSSEDFELYIDRVVKRVKDEDGEWNVEVVEEGTPVAVSEPFQALAIEHWITIVPPNEEYVATPLQVKVSRSKGTAIFNIKKANLKP